MFYDLCIPWSSCHADIQRNLAFLSERTSSALNVQAEVDETQLATMLSASITPLRANFRLTWFVSLNLLGL